MTTAKKIVAKPKRPPRQVWLLVVDSGKPCDAAFVRRKDALEMANGLNEPRIGTAYRVVGPYVLAERVRER